MRPLERPRDNPTKRWNEAILARAVDFVPNRHVRGIPWDTFVGREEVYYATYKGALLVITQQFIRLISLGVGETERHARNIYVVPTDTDPQLLDFNSVTIMQRDFEFAVDILRNHDVTSGAKPQFGLQNEDGTPLVLAEGRLTDSSVAQPFDQLYTDHVKSLAYMLAREKSRVTEGGRYARLYEQISDVTSLDAMQLALASLDSSGYGV